MKKFKVHSLIGLLLVMATALVINLLMPITLVCMATGTVIASPVSQEDVTGGAGNYSETTEYIDMKDVQRKVELYKPYQTPIMTLMSDQSRGKCDSWEKQYYAIDSRGMSTTITSATAIGSGVTTFTLADSSFFTMGNTVYVPEITGATKVLGGRTIMGIVTGIPNPNQITVKLINPAVAGSNLAYGDFAGLVVYRGGSAHNAKTASTTSWASMPDPDFNYVQLFMEQVEIENFQEKMTKKIDWNFADMKRAAIEDFKLQIERSFLNGVRSVTDTLVAGQTQRVYTCGGFLQDTAIPVSANIALNTLDEKAVNGLMKTIFKGNNGMKKRFLLGGADFIEALENVSADKKYILSKETDSVLGLEFVKLVSMFGTLDVCYYEQLDLLGLEKQAIVIDKSNIQTFDQSPFNIREIDLLSSGVAKVTAAAIEQTSTMIIKNKPTHRILQGV
jgi:hypothetical protein